MHKYLLLLILLFTLGNVKAQPKHQGEGLLLYNTAFGAISCGLGAMINKKEGQRWYQALAKGAIQGSLGGVLIYGGKRLVYPINQKQNFMYGWPAKLVHSTGASILENAAGNRNFWESWSLHLGFIRLHLQTHSPHVSVRILPYSIGGLIVAFRYGKLDLKTSLQLGTLYLKRDSSFTMPGRNYLSNGVSYVNSTVVIEKFPFYHRWKNKYSVAAHEYVHEFQFREFLVFNQYWLTKKVKQKLTKYKVFRIAEKMFYPEIDYLFFARVLEGNHHPDPLSKYYKNYYEMEAQHFAVQEIIPVCR